MAQERMTVDEYRSAEKKGHGSRKRQEIEFQEQCKVFVLLRDPLIEKRHPEVKLIFSTLNGIHAGKAQAGKAKASGNLKGVADIICLVPRMGYHGLLIEMKSPTGTQSKEQAEFMENAQKEGYYYAVYRSADNVIRIIEWYLGIRFGQ